MKINGSSAVITFDVKNKRLDSYFIHGYEIIKHKSKCIVD